MEDHPYIPEHEFLESITLRTQMTTKRYIVITSEGYLMTLFNRRIWETSDYNKALYKATVHNGEVAVQIKTSSVYRRNADE